MHSHTSALSAPPALVDEVYLSRAISISVPTLRKDRLGARTIPFIRVGPKLIRYDLARVLEALRMSEVGGPPQMSAPAAAKRGAK